MLRKRMFVMLLVCAACSLVLSACGSPTPTNTPTARPTNTQAPSETPTIEPTAPPAPTEAATAAATQAVAAAPTTAPTEAATAAPTEIATQAATEAATQAVAVAPTTAPTEAPTAVPTVNEQATLYAEATKVVAAVSQTAAAMPTAPTAVPTVNEQATLSAEATKVVAAVSQTAAAMPTASPIPPTASPVPPTATPVPPTSSPVPPTASPVPPTATEEPTAAPTREVAMATAEAATATATVVATVGACRTTGELVVGTDAAYPPFENTNTTTNEIEGFDIDLLDAIGAKAGFTPRYVNAPFDTIFTNLAASQFDMVISASTITEERSKTVTFSNPYFAAGQVIVVREADAATIKSPDDLAGKTVGVQLGTTGAEAAKQIRDVTTREYDTTPLAMQALANQDVDAVVADNVTALTIILNSPQLNLVVTGDPFTVEYYGIAIRQECTALVDAVNRGLAEVIADGTYEQIYRKYLGESPAAEFRQGGKGIVVGGPTPEPTAAPTEAMTATEAATAEATPAVNL
jgi:polar amino acid transport system substrate-binding protein